jgi:hypothetical protein
MREFHGNLTRITAEPACSHMEHFTDDRENRVTFDAVSKTHSEGSQIAAVFIER